MEYRNKKKQKIVKMKNYSMTMKISKNKKKNMNKINEK